VDRLSSIFEARKAAGRLAFMPYITAGYPTLAATGELIRALAGVGCDVIEVGIPFSDPLADGPTIQMSSQRALDQGTSSREALSQVAAIRDSVDCGLVAMTYVNPVHRMGYGKYAQALTDAGFDGVIVPDLPPEEGEDMYHACSEKGVDSVLLVAPTSPDERITLAAGLSSGFLYCVSLTGVTGARQALSDRVRPFLERVRSLTALPLALGFGISTPEHVREVAGLVDGVIVGSAIVDVIHRCDPNDTRELVGAVKDFVSPLIEAAEKPR